LEICVQLYSILRERQPTDSKGRIVLRLDEGAALSDLIHALGIKRKVTISLNGIQETDRSKQLEDGDEVKIFSSVSGG
jgi:molybdopterin converting factor small subunit